MTKANMGFICKYHLIEKEKKRKGKEGNGMEWNGKENERLSPTEKAKAEKKKERKNSIKPILNRQRKEN